MEKLPGVGQKTATTLRGWEITTVGELAQVPPTVLRRLVGAWGDVLHHSARGEDTGSVSSAGPAKSISRETTFGQDTLDVEFLASTLPYLSERVGAQLRKEGKLAHRAVMKLRYKDFQTISRHRVLANASDTDEDIFSVGLSLLRGALEQRRAPVRLIGIGDTDLIPRAFQLSLLDSHMERGHSLALAVDTIRGKYGFTSIQRGLTFFLDRHFGIEKGSYLLKTSALSR